MFETTAQIKALEAKIAALEAKVDANHLTLLKALNIETRLSRLEQLIHGFGSSARSSEKESER